MLGQRNVIEKPPKQCMGVCKHWTGLDYWTTGLTLILQNLKLKILSNLAGRLSEYQRVLA